MKRGGRSEPMAGSHAGGKKDGGRDQKGGKEKQQPLVLFFREHTTFKAGGNSDE